jgi:hypothetical protein
MKEKKPSSGKIELHGSGMGVPSTEDIERRAREIALIDERNPDEFTDADWSQARAELRGVENNEPPEETPENSEMTEEWEVVASSKGHRAPRRLPDEPEDPEEDETVGEQLVSDGREEAAHDQMVEARKEELEQEGEIT